MLSLEKIYNQRKIIPRQALLTLVP